jgi:hypothetical protein
MIDDGQSIQRNKPLREGQVPCQPETVEEDDVLIFGVCNPVGKPHEGKKASDKKVDVSTNGNARTKCGNKRMQNHVQRGARMLLPFRRTFGIFIPAACYESNRPLFSLCGKIRAKRLATKARRYLDLF